MIARKQSLVPIKIINELALYFPYLSKVLKNVNNQLHFKSSDSANTSNDKKMRDNANAILNVIKSRNLLPSSASSFIPELQLRNTFTGYNATKDQEHDLLHFYDIGQNAFDNYSEANISERKQNKHKKHQLKGEGAL